VTRGYGENRELFEGFPQNVEWFKAWLSPRDLAAVRYIEYSYWNELSAGSRRPADAARRIKQGQRAFDVPNGHFLAAAAAVQRGEAFPPLILAGVSAGDLVCLEGRLRLTAYALAGFPRAVECLWWASPLTWGNGPSEPPC